MSIKHSRREVISHLIELNNKEIEALEKSHQIYAEGADLDEESTLELDDFAQQSQSTDSARNIQKRINQLKDGLEDFKSIRPEFENQIGEGNIVFTDKLNFVIGLAVKEFEMESEKFIGISKEAPIFKALEGKSVGDKVEFNGISYSIKEVL